MSPYPEDVELYPVSVQGLWDYYKLDRLIATEKVNKVTILRRGWTSTPGNQTLDAPMTRISTEFQALDRVVAVNAVYG